MRGFGKNAVIPRTNTRWGAQPDPALVHYGEREGMFTLFFDRFARVFSGLETSSIPRFSLSSSSSSIQHPFVIFIAHHSPESCEESVLDSP